MIYEISNFLNPDACKAAIDYFESIDPDDPDKESPKNLFFNKRIKLPSTMEYNYEVNHNALDIHLWELTN